MNPLYDFYLAALRAELLFAPDNAFGWQMATYYCRWLMALEAQPGIEDLV